MNEHFVEEELNYHLGKSMKKFYKFREWGEDLSSVVSRILANKNLNLWMFSHLPKDSGIYLGESQYFDDVVVKVPYGLTINFERRPRKTELFIGESILSGIVLKVVTPVFPDYSKKDNFVGWPSADEFLRKVNNVFSDKDIEKYLKKFEQK